MALEHHNHQPDIYIDCKVPYTRKVRIFVLDRQDYVQHVCSCCTTIMIVHLPLDTDWANAAR